MPGEPLDEEQFRCLSDQTKIRLAEQIAGFFNELNAFPVEYALSLGVPLTDLRKYYANLLIQAEKHVFPLIDNELQTHITKVFEWYLSHEEHFTYEPKLIHGDFSLDHMLYDSSVGELTGIIDFGDMQVGDSDYDEVYLLEECGQPFLEQVTQYRNDKWSQEKLGKLSFFLTADNVLYFLEGINRNDEEIIQEAASLLSQESKSMK